MFIPKALGVQNDDDFIDSDNPEYVMSQIREKYIGDSSVTIVLIGTCTHSRRYVDWEIKASLTKPAYGLPNGLFGILLPSLQSAWLPDRLRENLKSKDRKGYARFYYAPQSADQLAACIEDAYKARTERAELIVSPQDMMHYDSSCLVHHVCHQ